MFPVTKVVLVASLSLLQQERELLVARGLAVLGAWALLNLLVGGYHAARLDRRQEAFHFHLMNASWGLINVLLAGAGLAGLYPAQAAAPALGALLAEQLRLETLLLFNAGLDAAYVMTGCWLRARAKQPAVERPERLAGFGRSLWVQGGFLLIFDVSFWLAVHQFAAPLLTLLP